MKNISWCLGLLSLLSSCSKEIKLPTCDLNTNYVKDASLAQKWLVGEWKLVGVTTMLPNPPVENVRLRFTKQGEVAIIRDGKLTDTNRYAIVANPYGLTLKTDAKARVDNWYVRNPALRLCSEKMFLDGGIASDGPGFTFQRSQ